MKNNNSGRTKIFLQIFICFALISTGTGAYIFFVKTKPQVKKTNRQKSRAVYVDVSVLKKQPASIEIDSMGEVNPEKEVSLKPLVSGSVVKISKNFFPGGIVKKGEVLIQIEKRDYEIEVQKYKSLVNKAKAELDLEIGQQKSAKKELEFYEKNQADFLEDKNLALRKPQLESARADLESALADLSQKELDLSRTTIKAPFDAIIMETNVNTGSYISSQETAALIYGTDKYRIKAFIPADRLSKIDISKNRIKAEIESQTSSVKRQGYVKSISGKIIEESRMAEVLIDVKDPLGIDSGLPPLVVNDYVSVSVKCGQLDEAIVIPREYVHDHTYVWIYSKGRLDIRKIEILWKNNLDVIVKNGVKPLEKLITSPISIPVKDMPLLINGQSLNKEKKHKTKAVI